MKHILITGVSTGIGRHAAAHFAGQGWKVFGTVRNARDAGILSSALGSRFVPLILDVTDFRQADEVAGEVARLLGDARLDVLVNNAGIATFGPLLHIPMEVFEHQMRVNVHGVLKVTQAFAPLLAGGAPGVVINIGSVSGTFVTPFLGPYCASKYALEALSDSMRRELDLMGIRVVLLQPASVKSAIWDKARQAETYAAGTLYEPVIYHRDEMVERADKAAMETERVTRVLWKVAQGHANKPRYLITRANLLYRIFRALPDRWVDNLFRRRLKRLLLNPG